MIAEFPERRPWAVVLVSLVFSPIVGMLYLGQGNKALAYVGTAIGILVVLSLAADYPFNPINFESSKLIVFPVFVCVGAGHAYILAKNSLGSLPQIWFARWYWIGLVALFLPSSVSYGARSLLWEQFTVSSSSMEPTLERGQLVFANKFAYGYSAASFGLDTAAGSGRLLDARPARGDIVVFRTPTSQVTRQVTNFLSRIVGLPGDRIIVTSGVLHINGVPVERKPLKDYEYTTSYNNVVKRMMHYVEMLPNGKLHHTLEETDTMPLDNTRVFQVPEGYFFVMGDNRDNALDSRFEKGFGAIPFENLVGRISP